MGTPTFHHFGVPTSVERDGEIYIEAAGVRVTDPDAHPYRVEFLRFDPDSCMDEAIRTRSHAAFMVDDLAAALEGRDVLVEPFDATETLRVAFITDGDALIELMQEIPGP
ncbi:MAG: hypothetical protein ABFS86_03200 [Planctomycetota bacterium]